MHRIGKRILAIVVGLGLVGLIGFAFRPKPLGVETARTEWGPMKVTVDEDGETRAHDRFTLAAPISGRLSRIELHEGDRVSPGTVIARISPLPLDPKELAETRARVQSTEALKKEAEEQVSRLQTEHQQNERDLARSKELARQGVIAEQAMEQAQSKADSSAKQLDAARFRAQSAQAELKRAEAGLISLDAQQGHEGRVVEIRSPVASRILRILEKSERVVTSGTPIVVLSNPNKIEIVADLLSTDAVKVRPGAPVFVENWGGPKSLLAKVRVVEPYGFTKVSALGVEEQRVNVIADFIDPPGGLGDGYRVDVRIVIWESPRVLKVPASALFRVGNAWHVFAVEQGRARQREVQVGHRNAVEAEITSGLSGNEAVVLHPENKVKDGVRVAPLQTS